MADITVVKIGGNVLDDAPTLAQVLQTLAQHRGPLVLVHGGGKAATRLADKLGVPQTLLDGRRITDAATLEIATMVYGGLVNKNLVASFQALGCNAIGLTGADADLIRATRRPPTPVDFGFVGDVTPQSVKVPMLQTLLQAGLLPIFCALTHDGAGSLLNTNADTMASALAKALAQIQQVRLVYVFEKQGVLRDINNPATLVPHIQVNQVEGLVADGTLQAGMIPKVRNAAQAVTAGVQSVTIGQAEALKDLLNGVAGTGTIIRT